MIQPVDGKQIDDAAMHAGFRVACAVHDPSNARMQNGPGTHGTGLQRDKKFAPRQPIIFQVTRGVAQGGNFSVRRRIVFTDGRVETTSNDLPLINDDSADRHLTEAFR